jgi:hypothetical protein
VNGWGSDLVKLHGRLDGFAAQYDGHGLDRKLQYLCLQAKTDAKEVVAPDAGGDLTLSNWWRPNSPSHPNRKRLTIGVRYDKSTEGPNAYVITPTPRSKGPWRVLEDGRKASAAGDKSFYTSRSGKVRARKSKGASASPAKRTWSKFSSLAILRMERRNVSAFDQIFIKVFRGLSK